MAENNNKLGDITKTSLDSIRSMLDANTIIGEPIKTASGTEIIPISKIFVGLATGGVGIGCPVLYGYIINELVDNVNRFLIKI